MLSMPLSAGDLLLFSDRTKDSQPRLGILCHMREAKLRLGTVRMAHLTIRDSLMLVGGKDFQHLRSMKFFLISDCSARCSIREPRRSTCPRCRHYDALGFASQGKAYGGLCLVQDVEIGAENDPLGEKAAVSHFCVLRSIDPSLFDIEAIHHRINLYAFVTGRHGFKARGTITA